MDPEGSLTLRVGINPGTGGAFLQTQFQIFWDAV